NVTLDDLLPAGLDLDGAAQTPAGVTCDSSLHCIIGTLAVGSKVQITVPTTATVNGTGTMDETVTVGSDTPDPQMTNNTTIWTLTGDPQADLQLTKTTSTATPFLAGGTATYDLTVTNNGPNSSVPTVTDTLPTGLRFMDSTESGSSTSPECSASGAVVTCGDGITPLTDGDSVTYHITVAVDPNLPDGSTLTNAAHVDGSIADPSTGNNDSTVVTSVRATTNLVATAMTWNLFSTLPAGPGLALPNGPTGVPATLNGTFVWLTMTFTNEGPAAAQDASFILDYDLNMTNLASSGAPYVDWDWGGGYQGTTSEPGCHLVQAQIVCPLRSDSSGSTSVAPGQTVTVSMLVGVRGDTPATGKGWVNVSTTTTETDTTDNYVEAPLTILPGVAHPIITKTAAAGTLVAGGTFTYTIQVYQEGRILPGAYWADALNVQITDALPAGFHATSVSTSQGTCTNSDTSIACDIGTVAGTFLLPLTQPGPTVTVTVTGTIDASTPAATGVRNTAHLTTSSMAAGPFNAHADVDIVHQADLRMFKFVDQTDTTSGGLPVFYAGGKVGYTLVAFNSGPSDSGTSTVTDTLPLGLTLDASSSPDCTVTTPGDATTQEVVTCSVLALPAGTGEMFRLVAATSPLDLRQPGTGPGCVPGDPSNPFDPASPPNPPNCDVYQTPPRQIDNTAVIAPAGTNPPADPDPGNNTAKVSAMLDVQADIAITATPSTTTPAAGDTITYTAISINNGPSVGDFPLGDVTFPPGFVPISWDVPGNVCTLSHDTATPPVYTLNCKAIPAAPLFLIFLPGQAVTSVITVQIPPDTPAGTYRATGHTYSQTSDPNPANNWVFVDVNVRQVSNLALTKTLVSPLVAGQPATYKLSVTNAGPSVANDIVVSDTVPTGLKFSSAMDPRGAPCPTPQTENGDTVLLCGAGTLAVGATASVTVTFQVDNNSTPTICNMALVGSLSYDPVADNNEAKACGLVMAAGPGANVPGANAPTGGGVMVLASGWWLVILAAALMTGWLVRWHRRLTRA
ncbi:MAG: DUF11 domain-containing protein, partial [Propionibacteriaceae bacterium]|nr:DUF11 domain-containing protein [Propionibacteriaceae bacterium]